MEHHIPQYHALAAELRSRKLLGLEEDRPLRSVDLTLTGPASGLAIQPRDGADPVQVEAAKQLCETWNWGGRKGPPVRVIPWREPDGSFTP